MLCALFRSCLILAQTKSCSGPKAFSVVASLALGDLRLESTDNGKGLNLVSACQTLLTELGLQCHNALFSWKIVFEANQHLYEMILSACSSAEEMQWKTTLLSLSLKESRSLFDDQPLSPEKYSSLSLDMRPIGNVPGQPGTLARRLSVQRAATVGPRTNVCQVVIKDTHAPQSEAESFSPVKPRFGRSQSLLSTNGRIPVLYAKRSDRVRMEAEMARIWTKELLPYPGMKDGQKDHHIRNSASSVMRKLSRSTIKSGFSKRSMSHGSLQNPRLDGVTEDHDTSSITGEQQDICSQEGSPPKEPGASTHRRPVLPKRTSSRRATKTTTDESKKTSRDGPSSGKKKIKKRWSSPLSLIRSMSTEKMKHLVP